MTNTWVGVIACLLIAATHDGPANRLRQGYGGPPKLYAKAEAGHYVREKAGHDVRGSGQAAAREAEWPINGGVDNIRYSPLTQINRDNVSNLKVAWTYDSQDAFKGSEMQSNPIVVDGVLYVTTPTLKVVAVNAANGREIWKFDPSAGAPSGARFRHRGVTVHRDRVFVTYRSFLWALDKRTGQPIKTFGVDGRIDLREGLDQPSERLSVSASTPGVVFENLLIMGSSVPETLPGSPGHIRAFDVDTGKVRWIFHTIPKPGEFGYDTWPKDAHALSGGANAWAGVTVDAALGMVFAATGSASFDFYGVTRHGDNLFADCVLALDARTGRRVWHFQGLGLSRVAESRDRDARRPEGGRGGPDHEAGLRLRARSADRHAALPRRDEEGAAIRGGR